jgi:acetylornithine deacetylase
MTDIDPIELTRELVRIPSTSGDEAPLARHVARLCERLGLQTRLHEAAPGRPNLLAVRGEPGVLLCTHLDTVPPTLPLDEDETHLYGRGVCDAKGIIACMLAACATLIGMGRDGFGLLLTVAEETDSLGAKRANAELALPARHIIVGEPTELRLAVAQKGILTAALHCEGRAAHGAYPEAGHSAVRDLVAVLADVYAADWGRSDIGENVLNVGRISGGVATNVIPAQAQADVQIRVASSVADVEGRLQAAVAGRARVEVLQRAEPLRLGILPGLETTVAGFGTDIPYLGAFGTPYLIGPGSILDAHTSHEKVRKADLQRATALYVRMVTLLLDEPGEDAPPAGAPELAGTGGGPE